MTIRRGASGALVQKLQARLLELKLYRGPVDGSFGGGTEGAIKTFQKMQGLSQDGCVGDTTWGKLFNEPKPPLPTCSINPSLFGVCR